MGRFKTKSDYEEIRNARIVENQARLANLVHQNPSPELRSLNSSPKSEKKKYCKVDYSSTVLRRSPRLSGNSPPSEGEGGALELVTIDYEEIRKARIVENQTRLATLGLQKTLSELRSLNSSPKSEKKICCKVDYSATVLRRSPRLSGQSPPSEGGASDLVTIDYEEIRKARIIENQARLATLGLQKTLSELRFLNSSPKSEKTLKRKICKVDYSATVLRRSARFSGKSPQLEGGKLIVWEGSNDGEIGGAKRSLKRIEVSEEDLRRRCESKARGSVYDPIYGICCHFCRQKKLCGEEDCKHCGDRDLNQPCIGKTDCSVCHSTNGILCRACLKVRYGEEMEEVRRNEKWMCPHCIEEKGTKPYWICNSSFCMKRRKMVPTGIAIYRAREMGYESVAHLLMAELSKRR